MFFRHGRRRQDQESSVSELRVEWGRCAGHGVCAAAIGEQISLDDWGYPRGVAATGRPIAADLVPAAQLAVRNCPAVALTLTKIG